MKKKPKSSFKSPVEFLQELQEVSEIKDYAAKQYETIVDLQKEIEQVKAENIHLKQLLTDASKVTVITPVSSISDEELIYLKQIQKLKKASDERELTLDEVKKLDLLNKNKHLTKEKTTVDIVPKQKDIPTARLLAMANRPIKDDDE